MLKISIEVQEKDNENCTVKLVAPKITEKTKTTNNEKSVAGAVMNKINIALEELKNAQ